MPKWKLSKKAQDWFESKIKVPCTGCKYCVPCPKHVDIPGIFEKFNNASMRGLFENTEKIFLEDYKKLVDWNRGANQCIKCGACVDKCPFKAISK